MFIRICTSGCDDNVNHFIANPLLKVGSLAFRTATYNACAHGHLNVVTALIASQQFLCNIMFESACYAGNIKIVRFLVDALPDVNSCNIDLFEVHKSHTSKYKDRLEILRLLATRGKHCKK
jgi:ankyrin repeat protein